MKPINPDGPEQGDPNFFVQFDSDGSLVEPAQEAQDVALLHFYVLPLDLAQVARHIKERNRA